MSLASPHSDPSVSGELLGSGEDEVDTERIDYAKTLEQAYDNLQNMLGKDGIKGLTSETTKLVQQQKGLMESLRGMGPMLKEAKTMMSGMKDMGSLESMKDMKERDTNEALPGEEEYDGGLIIPAWINDRLFQYQRTVTRI